MSLGIYDIRAGWAGTVQFLNADGATRKIIRTFTTAPTIITEILICNSDTIAHEVVFTVYDTTVYRRLWSINVPTRSGYDGIVPVVLTAAMIFPILGVISWPVSFGLEVNVEVAMVGASILDVISVGGYI